MRTANAFERVNEALSWFIGGYLIFAQWRAKVDRLNEFAGEMARDAKTSSAGARIDSSGNDAIDLKDVSVALPEGAPLLEPATRAAPTEGPPAARCRPPSS